MLKAEPLRTFPFGHGLQAELMLLPDCDVLENVFYHWRHFGTIPWPSDLYGGHPGWNLPELLSSPTPGLYSCPATWQPFLPLNCLNRVVVKVYRLPGANWESTVTVSVVPKLDKLDKLCIYSIVAGQGKNNKILQFHISQVFNPATLSPWQLYVKWITKFSSLESDIHSDIYQ